MKKQRSFDDFHLDIGPVLVLGGWALPALGQGGTRQLARRKVGSTSRPGRNRCGTSRMNGSSDTSVPSGADRTGEQVG